MKVLIVGGGGRESALAWAVKKSPKVSKVHIAPGNGGTWQYGRNETVSVQPPFEDLVDFVKSNKIDLTIVGPETPLVQGIVDVFRKHRLCVFGPTRAAARLEGSKACMKDFLARYSIPTARFRTFDNSEDASYYVSSENRPFVVKTDGLAAGKGAIVCKTVSETRNAIERIMVKKEFGGAGDKIVVEDILQGDEVSVFIVTDGSDYRWLASAQDHKRVFDNDEGPNTGGMGAYAPCPLINEKVRAIIDANIIRPTIAGMQRDGCPYTGILYIGLMITPNGPAVIEYNARMGDPEAQVVLPLLKTDFIDIVEAVNGGRLKSLDVQYFDGFCCGIVMASGGYPGGFKKGYRINGDMEDDSHSFIFHAGTVKDGEGNYLTDGGRVLCVSSLGKSLQTAIDRAYDKAGKISFTGAHYRKDIGQRGLGYFK